MCMRFMCRPMSAAIWAGSERHARMHRRAGRISVEVIAVHQQHQIMD
jgi:hypothetical protein